MFTRKRTISLENRIKFRHNGTATRNIMSKFLDSRFNKISYLTPPLFLHLISPQKLTSLGVESEGRFRRVASHVFGIQNACASRISDGPDGPKFDKGEGFPALPPPAGGQGAAPSGARFARSGWSSPSRWAGSGCQRQGCAFARPSQSSPCSPCGLCVAPGCSGRPLTLPHPQNAPTGLSEPRGYVQAAFRGHRAPNSPRRASTASRRAFWACMVFTSSASVVSRVGASSPARSALMLWRMARSSHSPSVWPSRWAAAIAAFLASAVTPRTDHGAGRGPFWQFSASIKSLQRKQCIIKKWSTQAYQKAYQIRPSPLRRNGRCRLQAQSVLQPCPTGEVRGRVSKAAKPGAEQPGATHSPQGEHGEDCEHPPFDTALGAAPPVKQTDIGPSGPST